MCWEEQITQNQEIESAAATGQVNEVDGKRAEIVKEENENEQEVDVSAEGENSTQFVDDETQGGDKA